MQTPGTFPTHDYATSPASSGGRHPATITPLEGYDADLEVHCSCRQQIAEEEDKLFAHTLAVSYVQDALPLVPHLSFEEGEGDIVRVQSEVKTVPRFPPKLPL